MAGEYAAELAEQALNRSLNVMIFSDNVTDDEIRLKRRARDKDCWSWGGLRHRYDRQYAAGFR